MDDLTDQKLLRRTFHLAKLAKNRGNGAFGAILAEGRVVLFEGENTVTESDADLTCHAEMNVLREACAHYQKDDFSRFTLYCSTEPCAMCAGAAYYCGVGRVVFGLGAKDYSEKRGRGLPLGCQEILSLSPDRAIEVSGPHLVGEALDVHGFQS